MKGKKKMENRYRIVIEDTQTGETFMNPVECNGFMIVGCVGPIDHYEAMRVRMHNVSDSDMVNTLYTEPELRKAAMQAAWYAKSKRKSIWWRLFHRRPKGACEA